MKRNKIIKYGDKYRKVDAYEFVKPLRKRFSIPLLERLCQDKARPKWYKSLHRWVKKPRYSKTSS